MNPDPIENLIHRFLDGRATPEEAAQLSERIEREEIVRHLYLQAASLHATLAADETLRAPAALPMRPARASVWSLAGSIAAGVVIGGLAVSAVWAYTAPKTTVVSAVPLVNAGFETDAQMSAGGVPKAVGRWAGDPCEIIGPRGNVQPRAGAGMLRFLHAEAAGDFPGSKSICSDLWQVVALPGSGARSVKIRAWFNAETAPKQARFHLMAVAGAGDAGTAPALWARRYADSSDALVSARTIKFVDADPATWEPADLTLEVPAEARILIVAIAAYRLPVTPEDEWFRAQFADDVSVTISGEALP